MKTSRSHPCDRGQAAIDDVLAKALHVIDEVVSPSRILLIGSGARGEASFGTLCGRTELFSDLELIVLVPRQPASDARRRITAAFSELERSVGFENPFFHLDFDICRERVFWLKRRVDRHIASWELASNALVLRGPELDRGAYAFAPHRLDRGATNEILLRRLWMQLVSTPVQIAEGTETPFCTELLKLSLCRNLLDIATVLLPHSGTLLPSYRSRYEFMRMRPFVLAPLGDGALEAQREALEGKLGLCMPHEAPVYYRRFLIQVLRTLAFLGGESLRDAPLSLDLIEQVSSIVRRREGAMFGGTAMSTARIVRREARFVRTYLREAGLGRTLRWARSPRKALLVEAMLYAHFALLEIVTRSGGRDAEAAIGRADRAMQQLDLSPAAAATDVRDRWLALYERICAFMGIWKYNDPGALSSWGVVGWRDERGSEETSAAAVGPGDCPVAS